MDGGEQSPERLYKELADRFSILQESQNELRQQFNALLRETTRKDCNKNVPENETILESRAVARSAGTSCVPRGYFIESPYKKVLYYMGHAVYVSRVGSGEILYWNHAAENLFGYKDHEVVGRVVQLHFDEDHDQAVENIIKRQGTGESWSGQLTLKKRSGEIFKAMVTKSPLFEEGELVGIINMSSDANIFNNTNSDSSRTHHDHANDQPRGKGINWKKIQCHPQLQISAVPQIASSVSNLASKVLLRKLGDTAFSNCRTATESEEVEIERQSTKADRPSRAHTAKPFFNLSVGNSRIEVEKSERDDSTFENALPSKMAAKVLSKLHLGGISRKFTENIQQNGSDIASKNKDVENKPCSRRASMGNIGEYQESVEMKRSKNHLPRTTVQLDEKDFVPNIVNMKSMDAEDELPKISVSQKHSSEGSDGNGVGSTSSRDDSDSQMVLDCEILWKDLQLREEIGQGSFAVVYRGIWNASDVAVKVYCGNQYNEGALNDYKKEIDIMRRLRHPNVLLFMGAACSQEKLAIVTEYLPRGSLFKTLHKNNQSLDVRRRLRMAIDVARGMNYLHRRNPPIVHRDLKSSNLLVDKSWTVKVGDFGLSKLKNTTFLTTKSGRGTPQWMAPEVLRNEPSTEKSDVFSFGVILWELMTECIPWSNLNSLQVVGVVGFMDRRLDLPINIDPHVSSIISDCWQSKPENRPSFEDIIHKMTDLVHTGAGVSPKTIFTP